MQIEDKIAVCIRLASEYRVLASASSSAHFDDVEIKRKMTFRDAIPKKWSPSILGKIAQVLLFPVIIAFALIIIYIASPISNIFRTKNAGKASIATGRSISDSTVARLAAETDATCLLALWNQHGLSERSSSVGFAARVECLERWVDVLYGKGMAIVSRIRPRIDESQAERANARVSMKSIGVSISQTDAIDDLVGELSAELPSFR